jgi:hypothetical protein
MAQLTAILEQGEGNSKGSFAMKALFYPGCSMQKNARPYLDSLLAIRDDIDLELQEVEDWNCCGATEYMSVHRVAAHCPGGPQPGPGQGPGQATPTCSPPVAAPAT